MDRDKDLGTIWHFNPLVDKNMLMMCHVTWPGNIQSKTADIGNVNSQGTVTNQDFIADQSYTLRARLQATFRTLLPGLDVYCVEMRLGPGCSITVKKSGPKTACSTMRANKNSQTQSGRVCGFVCVFVLCNGGLNEGEERK